MQPGRHSLFRFAAAFCAGASALFALPALWPRPALAALAVAACAAWRRWPAAAVAIAGFAWSQALATGAQGGAWPCGRDRERAEIQGRVASPALAREGRVDFDLDVVSASTAGTVPRRVKLAWYDATAAPSAGESWRFEARLRCPRGFANPGAPDRELALLRDGVDATGYVAGGAERLRGAESRLVERARERVAAAIASSLPEGPSAAVLQGLAVGVRGNIPDRLWDAFSATGIAHLVAISGLHVTGCAIAVLALVRLAWRSATFARLRARLAVESAVVAGATGLYAWLSGASLPALRTLATVALIALIRTLRRTQPMHAVLGAAALVLVASDPIGLGSAGFWLSFVATAALCAMAARGDGWRGRLAEFARAQGWITVLMTPVLAASFGRVSLVGPLANAVAIPAFGLFLLPAVLAATVLALASPAASGFLWKGLAALLDPAWPVLESVGAWRGSSWAPASQPLVLVAAAGALGFAALLVPIAGLRLGAGVMLAAILLGRADRPGHGAFDLVVVDVGQGLAALVQTARHSLVFDSGPRWRGGGTAARVTLLPVLRARGIRDVDLLVASHDDQDHAGGVEALAGALRVGRRMSAPGSALASDATCRAGDAWRWDGVEFRVVHPPAGMQDSDNERSCALEVRGPGGSALLLADPESRAEAALAARAIAADVVLLPHHGSRTSSSEPLVAATRARIGIASAGFGNRWGMPAPEVVARWREAGTTVLDTAQDGAVSVRFASSPGPPAVRAERRDHRRWWRDPPGG